MKSMMGGKGGYGGITTMNQDQRQSRYHPHNNITLYTRLSDNITEVKCITCHQKWEHSRGFRANTPSECRVEDSPAAFGQFAEGEEVEFEPYVTENNEICYRVKGSKCS